MIKGSGGDGKMKLGKECCKCGKEFSKEGGYYCDTSEKVYCRKCEISSPKIVTFGCEKHSNFDGVHLHRKFTEYHDQIFFSDEQEQQRRMSVIK